jgi:transposase InsO family protein
VRTTIPGKDAPPGRGPAEPGLHGLRPEPHVGNGLHVLPKWAGFVYVSFVVDVFAQKIVAWHAATCKDVSWS